MRSVAWASSATFRLAIAASVLAISFVCADAGSAGLHLVGSHGHASTHHASGRDSDDHSAVEPLVGHLECGDVIAPVAAGTCFVKIGLDLGDAIRATPGLAAPVRGSYTRARVWTESPPLTQPNSSPLRI